MKSKILGYHVHIYYHQRPSMEDFKCSFPNKKISFNDSAVGPHPSGQCLVEITLAEYGSIIEWLIRHYNRFSILIHPETDNSHDDHTSSALWLGDPIRLDLSKL